ncbi:FAD-dependent oxidoreductase [Bradyrhizobium sp. PMVTL-01]|uniref:FAD-dependent oxidoreductase n=1 Tax=Bradyrhizobium sp. PMVTL-01 TaxID=3434999 RepID=UPI003F6F9502
MKVSPNLVLPSPDFTCNPPGCVFKAGVRPFRRKTYRLEIQAFGPKHVVHNYGHGGAGITMSWGCADAVTKLVGTLVPTGTRARIAVMGAGVMGLTAATLLPNHDVTIYADRATGTTSDVAGGQWAPSVVKYDAKNAQAKQQFEDILRTAYAMHQSRGPSFGVYPRVNYTKVESDTFGKIPNDVVRPPDKLDHLPFQHLSSPGFGYHTLLVEPPVLLKRLRDDLAAANIVPQHRIFRSVQDVINLHETIIVNCTGLGSGKLFNDPDVIPITGQLVWLPAQGGLDWLYSTGRPTSSHVPIMSSSVAPTNARSTTKIPIP